MAASGFTPIQLFRTTTASATPTAMSLADGELAINLTDEKLYFKNAAGVVKLLAANLNAVANGGTGATTLSANGVLVGNGTSAVTAVVGTTGRVLTGNTGSAPTFEPITNLAVSSLSFGTTGLTPATATTGAITVGGTLAVANGGTGVTTSTGTGSTVRNTSPTLVTPTLGAASATSIANGLGAVATPSYTFTGDLNTGMWSPAADTLAFSTGGAERVRITSAGNVGINSTNPAAPLDVNGAGIFRSSLTAQGVLNLESAINYNGSSEFFIRSRLDGGTLRIGTETSAGTLYYPINMVGATNLLTFNNSSGEMARFDSSGSLLVATTSASASNTGDGFVVSGANGSLTSRRTTGANQTHAVFVNGGTTVGSISTSTTATTYNTSSTSGITGVDANTVAIRTNSAERMRIDSSGNVGIGTSTPGGYRLNIRSDQFTSVLVESTQNGSYLQLKSSVGTAFISTPAADAFAVHTGASATERMRITSAGNVGIGTSSPGSLLTLSSAQPRMDFVETDVASANTTRLVQEDSVFRIQTVNSGVFIAEDYAINRDADGAIAHRWRIQNTERMRIDSAGNVGIGTSSPNAAARLDVTSTTSGFLPPRMTTTQRDAIGSPPNGLMLYNTTTNKLQVRAGGAWVDLH
jgi:hypothetical protein